MSTIDRNTQADQLHTPVLLRVTPARRLTQYARCKLTECRFSPCIHPGPFMSIRGDMAKTDLTLM